MNQPSTPPKADLPKASPTAAPGHINPPAEPAPGAEVAPVALDLKEQRRAVRAARGSRDDLEDNCYEVLDAVRVLNEDGSGKSLDQLHAETGLSLADLHAALDQLEGQNLIERSVSREKTLVYHARPGIPATPAIVIVPAPVIP